MIREAKLNDIPSMTAIVSHLVLEAGLRPSDDIIADILRDAISARQNRALVSTAYGEVVGLMVTQTSRLGWAEKMSGTIMCLTSPVVGDSKAMLEDTMEWVRARRAIQLVAYTSPMKTKVDKLLLANGFESTGSMILWRRYNGSV